MILDLGCGSNKRHPDAVGVDVRDYPPVDVVHDIETGLPFTDGSVSRVYAYSVLEHLSDLETALTAIHRVCKDGAVLEGKVPHYKDRQAYTDPTHEHLFTTASFDYWDSTTEYGQMDYFDVEYRIRECDRVNRIQFWKPRPILFELEVVK